MTAPASPGSGPIARLLHQEREITRVEALSDGVFAFAITLLVVSLEVPATFDELLEAMRGFLAFGICFTFLLWIWHQHYRFFRRFPLQDALTQAINGVLLFVVLFYVYPLKFLWTLLVRGFSSGSMTAGPAGDPVIRAGQGATLMIIYGMGFVAVFLCLAFFYLRVWLKRKELNLDELDLFDARSYFWENAGVAGVGIVSMLIASLGDRAGFYAGISYTLVGVVKGFHGHLHAKWRASLARRLVLAKAVANRSPLEERTAMGGPQPPQRKIDDTA